MCVLHWIGSGVVTGYVLQCDSTATVTRELFLWNTRGRSRHDGDVDHVDKHARVSPRNRLNAVRGATRLC